MIRFKPAICLSAFLLIIPACAKPRQELNHASASPSPEATPAGVIGESTNWRVTVESVIKLPKPSPTPFVYVPPELRTGQTVSSGDFKVYVTIEYLGAPGDVLTPQVAVIDANGRRFKIIGLGADMAALTPPELAPKVQDAPPTEAGSKFVEEILEWLHPTDKLKSRKLSTGDKFPVWYGFEDPKSENLKFVFGDVTPIPLPPAKAAEQPK